MIDGEEGVVVGGGGFGGGRVGHSGVAGKKVAAWFLAVLAVADTNFQLLWVGYFSQPTWPRGFRFQLKKPKMMELMLYPN